MADGPKEIPFRKIEKKENRTPEIKDRRRISDTFTPSFRPLESPTSEFVIPEFVREFGISPEILQEIEYSREIFAAPAPIAELAGQAEDVSSIFRSFSPEELAVVVRKLSSGKGAQAVPGDDLGSLGSEEAKELQFRFQDYLQQFLANPISDSPSDPGMPIEGEIGNGQSPQETQVPEHEAEVPTPEKPGRREPDRLTSSERRKLRRYVSSSKGDYDFEDDVISNPKDLADIGKRGIAYLEKKLVNEDSYYEDLVSFVEYVNEFGDTDSLEALLRVYGSAVVYSDFASNGSGFVGILGKLVREVRAENSEDPRLEKASEVLLELFTPSRDEVIEDFDTFIYDLAALSYTGTPQAREYVEGIIKELGKNILPQDKKYLKDALAGKAPELIAGELTESERATVTKFANGRASILELRDIGARAIPFLVRKIDVRIKNEEDLGYFETNSYLEVIRAYGRPEDLKDLLRFSRALNESGFRSNISRALQGLVSRIANRNPNDPRLNEVVKYVENDFLENASDIRRSDASSLLEVLIKVGSPEAIKFVEAEKGRGFSDEIDRSLRRRLEGLGQQRRRRVVRESPALRTALELLNRNPLWRSRMTRILARGDEFKTDSARIGEKHRDYTPYFAAAYGVEEAKDVLDEAVRRAIEVESQWLRDQIDSGSNYTRRIILGMGWRSAVLNSELLALEPEFPPSLTVAEDKGTFEEPEGDVFRLNSRNRPERGLSNIPGTQGNINPMGRGVLELSDLSGDAYATNMDLARAIRVNSLLSSMVLSGARVTVTKNSNRSIEGAYRVDLKDNKSGQIYTVYTDQVIDASGAGKDRSGFDPLDEDTRVVLAEEATRFESGDDAKVLTFSQYMEWHGDRENMFPKEKYRQVAVMGSGDGGKVVIENLLGYGPSEGNSVTQLDFPERVYWFSQDALTKEQFLAMVRPRYAQLGLEFPRQSAEDYYSRIVPVPLRATKLRRNGDELDIISESGERYRVDHVIQATGYEDEASEIFPEFYQNSITSPERIKAEAINYIRFTGTRFVFGEGNVAEVQIKRFDQRDRRIIYKVINRDGSEALFDQAFSSSDQQRTLITLLRLDQASEIRNGKLPQLRTFSGRVNNRSQDVAVRYEGEEIYRIGPAARLSISPDELRDSPAFRVIPENSAAGFRDTPLVKAFAQSLVASDRAKLRDRKKKKKPELGTSRRNRQIVELPDTQSEGNDSDSFQYVPFEISQPEVAKALASPFTSPEFLQFAVGADLYNYRFPDSVSGFRLVFRKFDDIAGGPQFSLQTTGIPGSPEFASLVNALLADKAILKIVAQNTHRASGASFQTFSINIPLRHNKVNAEGVSWTIPRTREEVDALLGKKNEAAPIV